MASVIKVNEIQNTSGTTALSIDGSGRVFRPNVPAFKASKTSSQTTTTSDELITFAEVFDQGNNFSSSVFTCPVDGLYFFSCQWLSDNSTDQHDLRIIKNASTQISNSRNSSATGHETTTMNHVGLFVAGDTVKITASSTGQTVYGDSNRWSTFMGYLIG